MSVPTFPEFFRALQEGQQTVHDPFPWQRRLAEQVVADGWPGEIGVPTGLGKTACIDIAVWAMAVTREAPTRLWYVVNRRLLVDAAHERAVSIADKLASATDGPLAAVADALRVRAALGVAVDGTQRPLHVVRLRGGVPLDVRAPDPSQPAIVLATVPMFGSRALLRGYGVSRGMRPIAAAHAGIDCTVLLDEAHLSEALQRLQGPLREVDPGDPGRLLPTKRERPRLVALTATGGSEADRFDLDDEDLDHAMVQQRVSASKPALLVESKERALHRDLARATGDLLSRDQAGMTCVVFVNTARAAPHVARELGKDRRLTTLDAEVLVLTGRMRGPDATRIRDRLLGQGGVGSGWSHERERPLVVVATQTLEVGADLDFEHLVTETAGVRALVQRVGRCNRLGTRNDLARLAIVHPVGRGHHPVYGDEVDVTWERLVAAADDQAVVDLGPANLTVLGNPADAPNDVPSLLPHHLWEWAKTSVDPDPSTPVEPFFAGLDDDVARVSVLWRWWVPDDGVPVTPAPSAEEVIGLPIGEVRSFLAERASDTNGANQWCEVAPEETTARLVSADDLRPGMTLVLSTALGGYRRDIGWSPDARTPVDDLSLAAGHVPIRPGHPLPPVFGGLDDDARTDIVGRLETIRIAVMHDAGLDMGDAEGEKPDAQDVDVAIANLAAAVRGLETCATEVASLVEAWLTEPVPGVVADVVMLSPSPRASAISGVGVRLDAFDDLSFDATSTTLADHLSAVGDAARRIGEALGLPAEVVEAVALAGELHDVGKADPRFQRVLDPAGTSTELLAKSVPQRVRRLDGPTGWPRGGRHEELSGRAVRRWFDDGNGPNDIDRELVVHLIVSHHGHGRSLVPPVPEGRFSAPVDITVDGTTVRIDGNLGVTDWDQPARFRRLTERYGTWGLALLESVVRQADHAASAASSRRQREDRA